MYCRTRQNPARVISPARRGAMGSAAERQPRRGYGQSPLASPKPALITVAITGDVPTKDRVNVPITPEEQVEQICRSFEAGARMVHIHVRDEQGKPTWKKSQYKLVMDGVRRQCPEMILQFSTGNYAPTFEERSECLDLRPEMASLTCGSVNFKTSRPGKDTAKMYINTHEDIDRLSTKMKDLSILPDVAIFDLSMIYSTAELVKRGLIKLPVRLMFVLGGHMALEARREVLQFFVSESDAMFGRDNYTWCSVGVGWNHGAITKWCLEMGGHPRTGFEDSLMLSRGKFATSNEELVRQLAELCEGSNRPIATVAQARQILGLHQ